MNKETKLELEQVRKITYENKQFCRIKNNKKKGKDKKINEDDYVEAFSFEDIKEVLFKEIKKLGFSHIEETSPQRANCIIKLYRLKSFCADKSAIEVTYVAHCFTAKAREWYTNFGELLISLDEFELYFESSPNFNVVEPGWYFLLIK